jgi:hypothetical protein
MNPDTGDIFKYGGTRIGTFSSGPMGWSLSHNQAQKKFVLTKNA